MKGSRKLTDNALSPKSFFERNYGPDEDDGRYRPWVTCQQGSVSHFRIVPTPVSGQMIQFIPYLQPISIELSPDGHQLAILCPSSGHRLFLEGQGLDELAEQLSERRIKSIRAYDYDQSPAWEQNGAYISNILIELK